MVLHHVPEAPRLLEVAAARLDAEGLGAGDLHVIDEAIVPDRLEDAVRESEHQQVLDGLLPEVVIDPVDLPLVERSRGSRGSARGRSRDRVPKGFSMITRANGVGAALGPGGEVRLTEAPDDGRERGGGRGEVEDAVAGEARARSRSRASRS